MPRGGRIGVGGRCRRYDRGISVVRVEPMDNSRAYQRASCAVVALAAVLVLSGCLATKVVTVPVKVAYGAGKLAVKGTAAAVRAVVPGERDDDKADDATDTPKPQPESAQAKPH